MYDEDTQRASSSSLSSVLDYFLNLQSQRKLRDIDNILESADVRRLAPEFMVGILRMNFLERNALRNWGEYLRKVEDELIRRNIPEVAKILSGL